ncbi:hypothetical protein AOQ88_00635 [Candidatus Riesia sp. GBBU]|nr:hypothetical protein AOQ88_00635 [Candidatus Riesia sp. GBBU]
MNKKNYVFKDFVFGKKDPIFGLVEKFNSDSREEKINLCIGIYKNELDKVHILKVVKQAENEILKSELNKNYLPMVGLKEFIECSQKLILGNIVINHKNIVTVQTVGGTGAIRIISEFISKFGISKRVWISNFSWKNHFKIFKSCGFEIFTYKYFDIKSKKISFSKVLEDLNKSKRGDVIIFQGCCHNPTGLDFTMCQLEYLSDLSYKRKLIPVFDISYQGLGNSLKEDVRCIEIFLKKNLEIFIVNSYSKNFCLYSERVGCLTFISESSILADKVLSQIKSIIRNNYSTPPSHGAMIVSKILSNGYLKNKWKLELKCMRERTNKMKIEFFKRIKKKFRITRNTNGMFSILDIDKEKIRFLRKKYAIYLEESGRINFSCLTDRNISYVCNVLNKVL